MNRKIKLWVSYGNNILTPTYINTFHIVQYLIQMYHKYESMKKAYVIFSLVHLPLKLKRYWGYN